MSRICHQHCPPGNGGWLPLAGLLAVSGLAAWAMAQLAWLLAAATGGTVVLTGLLLLGLQGVKRRYAVAYHPAGRHGLAYKPGRAVTGGTSAAALGFTAEPEAIPAQPATLHWTVTEQVIER